MAKLTMDEHFKLLRSELKEIRAENLFVRTKMTKIEDKILAVAADQENFRKEVSTKFDKLEKNLKAYIHDAADTILNGVDEIFKGHSTNDSYTHITA